MKFKLNRIKACVEKVGQNLIDAFIQDFQNYCDEELKIKNTSKFDLALLEQLCNIIENAYVKKDAVDEKLDKKNVVIDEYIRLKSTLNLQFNAEDKKQLGEMIEHLHSQGYIKVIPMLKYIAYKFKTVILKKKV